MGHRYSSSEQEKLRTERRYPIIMEINVGQRRSIDWNAIDKVVDCVFIVYASVHMHKDYLPCGVVRFKTIEDMFLMKLML
jgi:hypothetical protein